MVAPRKDLTDPHRNTIQDFQRLLLAGIPYVTGTYDHGGDDLDAMWSMSRAVNAGAEQVTTPGLIVTPADYVINPMDVATAEQLLDQHPWVPMFARTLVLDQPSTLAILRGGEVDRAMSGRMLNVCIPCTAVRADVFADIGGMDPRFAGWGPEDVVLRHKLWTLYGPPARTVADLVVELAAPGTGIWLGSDYTGPTPNRQANEALADRYRAATTPDAVRALIAETRI